MKNPLGVFEVDRLMLEVPFGAKKRKTWKRKKETKTRKKRNRKKKWQMNREKNPLEVFAEGRRLMLEVPFGGAERLSSLPHSTALSAAERRLA